MRIMRLFIALSALGLLSLGLSSCATYSSDEDGPSTRYAANNLPPDYSARLPQHMDTRGQKTVLVDPNVHAWGAYDRNGSLLRAGQATAGSNWCPDIGRPCRTSSGTYHIQSLGSAECKSTKFPVGHGGAEMPYCMYFHGGQALHGVPANEVVDGNVSHGCVRMHVADAEWLRFNFADVGTKVVVKPY